jgi:Cytosine/adenosine deaminases
MMQNVANEKNDIQSKYIGLRTYSETQNENCLGSNMIDIENLQTPNFDDETRHQRYMQMALVEAVAAFEQSEVPVGAVIVHRNTVIAAAHNQREQLQDPTAHAEMIAITQAAESLGSWRLEDCTLYVTLEPCPMCAGAIVQARIPFVVFGATDPKTGAVTSLFELLNDPRLNHRCEVKGNILADSCSELLREFFRQQRQMGKK